MDSEKKDSEDDDDDDDAKVARTRSRCLCDNEGVYDNSIRSVRNGIIAVAVVIRMLLKGRQAPVRRKACIIFDVVAVVVVVGKALLEMKNSKSNSSTETFTVKAIGL